jgi:hypothetical protein
MGRHSKSAKAADIYTILKEARGTVHAIGTIIDYNDHTF